MKNISLLKDPGKLIVQEFITKQHQKMLGYGSNLVLLFIQAKFGVVPYKHQETASKAFKSHHREGNFLRERLSSSCPNIGQTIDRQFSGFWEILYCHTSVFSCFPNVQFQKTTKIFIFCLKFQSVAQSLRRRLSKCLLTSSYSV